MRTRLNKRAFELAWSTVIVIIIGIIILATFLVFYSGRIGDYNESTACANLQGFSCVTGASCPDGKVKSPLSCPSGQVCCKT